MKKSDVMVNGIYRRIHTDSVYRVLEIKPYISGSHDITLQRIDGKKNIFTVSDSYFLNSYELVDNFSNIWRRG